MTSGNATSGHGGWNRLPKEGLVQPYVSLSQRRNRGQAALYCADVAVRAVESPPWAGVRDAYDLWTCALRVLTCTLVASSPTSTTSQLAFEKTLLGEACSLYCQRASCPPCEGVVAQSWPNAALAGLDLAVARDHPPQSP